MTNALAIPRSPTVLRIRAAVAADGAVSAFGLTYRPDATPATLRALTRVGWASLLVDATDIGSVLVREPLTGSLVQAECTLHAYAAGLSLPVHAAARRSARIVCPARDLSTVVPCRMARPASHPGVPTLRQEGASVGSDAYADVPSRAVQVM